MTLGIDIDIRPDYLEDHWADECKCESTHESDTCSGDVAALLRGCMRRGVVCQNAVVTARRKIAAGHRCLDCKRPAAECWRVIPV